MPTSVHDTDHERAELELLAAELGHHGLRGELRTPPGSLPYLQLTASPATVLAKRIYAQAGGYWYSWVQKIADTCNPADAASTLARVLATAGE